MGPRAKPEYDSGGLRDLFGDVLRSDGFECPAHRTRPRLSLLPQAVRGGKPRE
jgi:hypothetical protein